MSNSSDFTVFIIDDDDAVRHSLCLMIEQEGFNVQTFENAENFLKNYPCQSNGCIILDLNMPGMDGLQLQEALNNKEDTLPIVFLTGYGTIPQSVKAIKAGAVDFLTKPITREKLLTCIRSAVEECKKLLHADQQMRTAKSLLSKLTEREKEVLILIVEGYSNKEIAAQLQISHRTVEVHRSKIMQKTGANHLLELKQIAQESNQCRFSS